MTYIRKIGQIISSILLLALLHPHLHAASNEASAQRGQENPTLFQNDPPESPSPRGRGVRAKATGKELGVNPAAQRAEHLERHLSREAEADAAQRAAIRIHLIAAYRTLGQPRRAIPHARELMNELEGLADNPSLGATAAQHAADLFQSVGMPEQALRAAEFGVDAARRDGDAAQLAASLNTYGNALAALDRHDEADAAYREAMERARTANLMELACRAGLNRVRGHLAADDPHAAARAWREIAGLVEQIEEESEKARLRLTLGILATRLGESHHAEAERLLGLATKVDDALTRAMAHGHLAQLHEQQGELGDALRRVRQAIFHGQQLAAPQLLYRWLRLQGRLQSELGEPAKAIDSYRRAIAALEPVRDTITLGYRMAPGSFEEMVQEVYFELADLLLRQAEASGDDARRQALLREARDTVEQLRMAELANYFQDACVAEARSRQTSLDQVSPSSAVLYPLVLPDRLALIVSHAGDIFQFTRPVSRSDLRDTTLAFRRNLQTRPHNRFLYQAKTLYDWLIAPLAPELERRGIDTLVVIPDGPLRTIPFATLHDGERFLIERYALVTTPGLTLTDPSPLREAEHRALLAGVSDAVQDFSPLPGVPRELRDIGEITAGSTILNQAFGLDAFRQQLLETPYSAIHLATHGQFTGDPETSFLLTYDDRLTMDRLQEVIGYGKFREQPLELLTLSACQTALGDEQAALGLAGVAVKAGARSAIATLWFVDDEATSRAMREFYQRLFGDEPLSKAKALQQIQTRLLSNPRFAHPAYWGPFLLIGNWL